MPLRQISIKSRNIREKLLKIFGEIFDRHVKFDPVTKMRLCLLNILTGTDERRDKNISWNPPAFLCLTNMRELPGDDGILKDIIDDYGTIAFERTLDIFHGAFISECPIKNGVEFLIENMIKQPMNASCTSPLKEMRIHACISWK